MAILIINDKERRVEYTAQASETTFVYDWEIFSAGDLNVFQKEVLLTLSTDYTVTGAGLTGGGDVILNIPAEAGDGIVIEGDLIIDQTTDFTIKANFSGQVVQTQFNKLTIIAQELDTKLEQRALLYNTFSDLKPNSEDNILPVLAASQFWQMNATATGIFAAEFEIDPGANTLRSELISAQSGSDGAKIVGYFSPELGETTVKDQLDVLVTESDTRFKNLIIGGDFSTNPAQRGSTFVSPIADGTFPADRFRYFSTNGALLLGTTLPTPTGLTTAEAGIFVRRSLRFTVTSGITPGINDQMGMEYKVEGFDWSRIFDRDFTFSFFMFTTVPGIYSVSFSSTNETYVVEITQPAAVWTKQTITVSEGSLLGNGTNGLGLTIAIFFASGSNKQTATLNQWMAGGTSLSSTNQVNGVNSSANIIDFALFQLEPGKQATGFGVRSFAEELALCQRYFYKSYDTEVVPGTPSSFSGAIDVLAGNIGGVNGLLGIFDLPTKMRISATPNAFNPLTGALGQWAAGFGPPVSATFREAGQQRVTIGASNVSFVAGENYLIHITLNSEL